MRTTTRLAVAGLTAVAAATAASPALADGGADERAAERRCARQFDHAQREDMESFRDFDRRTWLAGHDDDAITVVAGGVWFQGIERIAEITRSHFDERKAVWSWTELTRAVDGCRTATILYDATYAIPSENFVQRAYTSVTYTYKRGKWLSVIDQGTRVAAS